MKRLALVPCLIAMLLVPGPARGAVPALAGHNVVVGTGAAAVQVQLDRKTVVDYRNPSEPPWFGSFETDGSFAAVLIRHVSARPRQELFYMELFEPVGCSVSGDCQPVTHGSATVRIPPGQPALPDKMILEPGTYWIYVFTDPGERVEASFDLAGIPGRNRFQTSVPVDARMHSRMIDSPVVSHDSGKFTDTMNGPGLVAGGTWGSPPTASPNDPRSISYYTPVTCFQKGRGDDDVSNTCKGHFNSGFNRSNLVGKRGTWTFTYHNLAATQVDGRIGAYAFFLTYL